MPISEGWVFRILSDDRVIYERVTKVVDDLCDTEDATKTFIEALLGLRHRMPRGADENDCQSNCYDRSFCFHNQFPPVLRFSRSHWKRCPHHVAQATISGIKYSLRAF
jgi:hypothetical protein